MTSSKQLEAQNQFGQQFHQYTLGTNMNSTSTAEPEYIISDNMEKSKQRSRRVLSLKERIAVIKIAEASPRRDTRALALKFECGRTQILSILSQKERLLREWANNGDPDRLRRRPSPIAFTINKVMQEWLFRCKCSMVPLTDREIVEKAQQAKQLFQYGEFRPNKRWLERFKKKFRIKYDGLLKLDSTVYHGMERSLELTDIYEDIKDSLQMSVSNIDMSLCEPKDNRDINFESSMNYDQTMSSSYNDSCEIVDSDHSYTPENFCETQFFAEEPTNYEEKNKSISNDEQALECLKKLEEYSMLNDNFRAIGLIVQLEKLYKGQLES